MTAALIHPAPTIVERPGAERSVVVVVPDDEVIQDHSGTGALVGGVIGAVIFGPLGAMIGAGLGAGAVSPGKQHGVARVALSEARANLAFPPGHPQPGESYAKHPHLDRRYIELGRIHYVLREEKLSELLQLLATLGATRVSSRVLHSNKSSGAASVGVNVPGVKVSAKARGSAGSGHDVQFDERYTPRARPHVPKDLVWLPHEASWQGLVTRRMQYGTNEVTARLEYTDDFGFNADLAAKVKHIGGKIAGGFTELKSEIWEFDAEFADGHHGASTQIAGLVDSGVRPIPSAMLQSLLVLLGVALAVIAALIALK